MLYLITPDNSVITVINKDIMKKVILTHQMNPDLVLDADADENGVYPVFRSVVVGICDEIGFESVVSKSGIKKEELKIVPYTQSLLGQLVTDYYNLLVQEHGLENMNQALEDAVKEKRIEDMSIDIDMICDIFDIDINTPTSLHKDGNGEDVKEDSEEVLELTPEEMEELAEKYGITPGSNVDVGSTTQFLDANDKKISPAPGMSLGEAAEKLIGVVPKTGILGEPASPLVNKTMSEIPGPQIGVGQPAIVIEEKPTTVIRDKVVKMSDAGLSYFLDDIVWEAAKSMAPHGVDPDKFADDLVAKCEDITKVEVNPTDDDDLYAAMGQLE